MRFAPPNPLRIADRASGLNSLSVRSHNERLVLSLLLQNEATTRLEIGEKTGLSAQTISVIVRSLEQEGLVVRGEAQKGRVGPPTTPLMLNSEGAYSVGVSVGYRNTHIVVVDFIGQVQHHRVMPHADADMFDAPEALALEIQQAIAGLSQSRQARIAGVGLALPTPPIRSGPDHDVLHRYLETELGLPIFVQNDITAAAGGESLFGTARQLQDFLFFYLGARLHGRLVLNHQIYNGNSPISYDVGVLALERALPSGDAAVEKLWGQESSWPPMGPVLDEWQQACAQSLVELTQSLLQFIELKTIVLSSFAPADICARLCTLIQREIPSVSAVIGRTSMAPKAVGAASLPFSSRFMVH
ncbi:ROK family transcriptional regulator [Shinella zoogloeoides]|uniref:ROK family protein n=1 Tax=Shinella zoogloeoides TaxID=352475 RepID=A0A6N8T8T2_SHIZO|nr:ROK family transcriptional regulator [Shinella zoogloeoides]MXN99626.1 ROK family protein [Shinella zoogloeoides]UEX83714.1 ROK family protein [Shinella zoogloeoides]